MPRWLVLLVAAACAAGSTCPECEIEAMQARPGRTSGVITRHLHCSRWDVKAFPVQCIAIDLALAMLSWLRKGHEEP